MSTPENTKPHGYLIEQDVPIPKRQISRSENPRIQVLRALLVGESVLLDLYDTTRVAQLTTKLRKEGYRFTSRRVENGVRVWRTA